tara:strand:- start:116 stop:475 length:360 start_codon:yes stop_codon:yes gene_type:complete
MKTIGTRIEVMNGGAKQTRGGYTKKTLRYTKGGNIVPVMLRGGVFLSILKSKMPNLNLEPKKIDELVNKLDIQNSNKKNELKKILKNKDTSLIMKIKKINNLGFITLSNITAKIQQLKK